jgi:hypothetical protein
VLTKDGWIEFGDSKLPSLYDWCLAVLYSMNFFFKAAFGTMHSDTTFTITDDNVAVPPFHASDNWGNVVVALTDVFLQIARSKGQKIPPDDTSIFTKITANDIPLILIAKNFAQSIEAAKSPEVSKRVDEIPPAMIKFRWYNQSERDCVYASR